MFRINSKSASYLSLIYMIRVILNDDVLCWKSLGNGRSLIQGALSSGNKLNEIGISIPLRKVIQDRFIKRGYDVFHIAYLHFLMDNLLRETMVCRSSQGSTNTSSDKRKGTVEVNLGFIQVAIRNPVLEE
jgi:hypothetical protein